MRIARNFALTKSFLLGVLGLLFLVACGGSQKTSVNTTTTSPPPSTLPSTTSSVVEVTTSTEAVIATTTTIDPKEWVGLNIHLPVCQLWKG